MILGRLREHQDKSSLAGALVKSGFVIVKAGKLLQICGSSSSSSRWDSSTTCMTAIS
jgi:hypothetical protein